MRYASTTFWAILLLAPASRATESVANAPSSSELLEIWNQSYPAGDASTDAGAFHLEAIDHLETTGSASADVDYSRPSGRSLTPNFDRLMSRYAGQPGGVASAPVAVQVQPLSQPRSSFGYATWKGGADGIITGGKKKKKDNDRHDNGRHDNDRHDNDRHDNDHHDNDHHDNDDHHNGGGNGDDCDPTTPTPEPGTLLLISAAAGAAGLRARRKRTQS